MLDNDREGKFSINSEPLIATQFKGGSQALSKTPTYSQRSEGRMVHAQRIQVIGKHNTFNIPKSYGTN